MNPAKQAFVHMAKVLANWPTQATTSATRTPRQAFGRQRQQPDNDEPTMNTANQPTDHHAAAHGAFPYQHTGPLADSEYRALQVLHQAAPQPVGFIARLRLPSGPVKDSFHIGVAYLQARGWARVRGMALSFTARGLREAPDRATVDAVKLQPLPEPVTRPACGPIEAVTARRMATLAHGADADAAIELSREIRLNGASSRAVEMALTACANVPPQAFASVLEPFGEVWLLTAKAPDSLAIH